MRWLVKEVSSVAQDPTSHGSFLTARAALPTVAGYEAVGVVGYNANSSCYFVSGTYIDRTKNELVAGIRNYDCSIFMQFAWRVLYVRAGTMARAS